MGMFEQLTLLVRGRASSTLQQVVDRHGLDIAEQALREAESVLVKTKHELASIVVQGRHFDAEEQRLTRIVAQRDADGRDAIARNREDLALRVADELAQRHRELERIAGCRARVGEQEQRVRDSIRNLIATIENYRAEYATLRSADAAQRAHGLAHRSFDQIAGSVSNLHAIMTRVRSLQDEAAARSRALGEIEHDLSGASLEQALESAGISGRQPAAANLLASWKAASPTVTD